MGFLSPDFLILLVAHLGIVASIRTAILVTAAASLIGAVLAVSILPRATLSCLALLISVITVLSLIVILIVTVFYPCRLLFVFILICVIIRILIIVHDRLSFPCFLSAPA